MILTNPLSKKKFYYPLSVLALPSELSLPPGSLSSLPPGKYIEIICLQDTAQDEGNFLIEKVLIFHSS